MFDVPGGHDKHRIHRIRMFRNDKQNVYALVSVGLLRLERYMYIVYGLFPQHNKHHIHRIRVFRNDRQNLYTLVQFWLLRLERYMYIVFDMYSSRVGSRWMHWFY